MLLAKLKGKGDGGCAMNPHPRYQFTLDELFLRMYIQIDDWLKGNERRFDLPKQPRQIASYSELFTIAVVGEMVAQPYESVWYWLVQQNHQDLFPRLPEYSRYHRILRNAERLLAELALSVVPSCPQLRSIDSKPLRVAKGKRANWSCFLGAAKGFSTMGMVFGFKLHAVTTEAGLFERWGFAPANESDVRLAQELLEGLEGEVILGDKAYLGSAATTPQRKNTVEVESLWRAWMDKARKRIESSFSSLVRSLTLHAAQVKTFRSLRTRVNLKIAAFNLLHSGLLFR